jgi:hypothetical protein
MSFKIPLSVYLIWHPEYIAGRGLASDLYSTLCRDISKPLVRSIGIPVYFRSVLNASSHLPAINFEEAENTAVIALISDELLLDAYYKKYLDDVEQQCEQNKNSIRLYPVALAPNAYNVSRKISRLNFIRVSTTDIGTNEELKVKVSNEIKTSLLHELCRLLLNMKKATEETDSLNLSPPIKLFISHSKHDESKAESVKFRDYINQETQLKTFFDATDIAFGSDFGEQIKKAAKESALVVFQSDSYSDREWCRIEILSAKSAGCPIVIVNAVEKGEKRIFPYMGNYPSIRLRNNFSEIVALTLEQVLRNLFSHRLINNITTLYGIKGSVSISTAPELFNFVRLKERGLIEKEEFVLVVYPDPPLGTEETDILNKVDDNFLFITPLMLPSIALK